MATQGFDTHDAYKTLTKNECFDVEQANRIVSVVKQAVTGEVATKADIVQLDAKIEQVRTELNAKIEEVRTELNAKIERVRTELNAKIEQAQGDVNSKFQIVRAEIAKQHAQVIKWMVGAVISVAGVVKALDFLLS